MNRYAYVGHSPTHLIDPMGTTAVAGGFSTSQGVVDTSVNIMHGFDAAWHNVVHGSSSSQELTWLSGAFNTASEYAGYAATAAVLVPGGQGAAGVLGTASLGFGLVSVGVDGINSYLNGSNFNQANAAGVGSGLGLNYISNAVSRAVPNRFSQPAAVAFDAVTQVSNFLFNTAAENERRAEQKRRREEEKRRQELYKLLHERR